MAERDPLSTAIERLRELLAQRAHLRVRSLALGDETARMIARRSAASPCASIGRNGESEYPRGDSAET